MRFPDRLDPAALTALPRDFVGYGPVTPDVRWPDGSSVAVNLVVNYEEGAEYSLLDGDPGDRHDDGVRPRRDDRRVRTRRRAQSPVRGVAA